MALPTDCFWIHRDGIAFCRYRASCIAVVRPGRVEIRVGDREIIGRCGSVAQGMRHLERWLAAHGVPLFDRQATRKRMLAQQAKRDALERAWMTRPTVPQRPIEPGPDRRQPRPLGPLPTVPIADHWRP